MLLISSACIILFYTFYYKARISSSKPFLSHMTGKTISMALGMVSSSLIGLIIAIPFQGQFAFSTIFSIVISAFVVGFMSQPFGALVLVEGLAASFMGSMMGAMLGEMLPANYTALMVIFMDVIYLISMFAIFMLVKKEVTEKSGLKASADRGRPYAFAISMALPLLLIGVATLIDNNDTPSEQPMSGHDHSMHE